MYVNVPWTDTNTTYTNMGAASASASGKAGLVPAPAAGAQAKYLRGDGTWQTPPNTTYSNMGGATSSAAGSAGLVPAPTAGKQTSFLRGDGTWVVPTNTTYAKANTTTLGLVMIGYTENGKNYPVELDSSGKMYVNVPWTDTNTTYGVVGANGSTGLVKNGSTVTSASGYTACPIVSGVPYYKDTNTTYANMKAATASAAGAAGLVPAPAAEKRTAFLRGDGTWQDIDVHEPGFLSDNFYDENDFRYILFNIAFSEVSTITQEQYDIIASKCEVDKSMQYLLLGLSTSYGVGDVIITKDSSENIQAVLRTGGKVEFGYMLSYNVIIDISKDLTFTSSISQYTVHMVDNQSKDIALTISDQNGDNRIINFSTAGAGTKALMDDGTYKSIPSLEDQYAYGVEWDIASSSPDGVRVGNMQLHRELPVQSKMRRCLLDRDGGVKEYLDNELSWGGSYLDYAVMTEIPEHWYKLYFNGTKFRKMLSEIPLPGYKHVDKFYISTYEARMYRTDNLLCSAAGASKLSDPNSTNFRGGDNTAEWDDTYRSLLGRPVTNLTRDQFRQAARKRGSGWEMYTYNAHKILFWLFAVEYATLDSQKPFNAQKDANGFAQGGLGPGPTQMTDWTNFNNANPLIPCGYTNEFGNGSGEKAYVVKNASGGTHATLMANRYRGIENPFGHIWKYTDGANIQVTTGDSGLSILWTTDDPSNFSDTSYTGYDKKGNICRTNGYAKKMLLGEDGDIVATEVGGSSSTYWCDYYYTYTQANRLQVVLVGGHADSGSYAGLADVVTFNAPSAASRDVGSRLCFFPEFRKTSA